MSAQIPAAPLPLVTDDDGVIRIAGTRIALDAIWEAFQEGLSAEAIAEQYPVLTLGSVYLVIGWMLTNPAEVERYVLARSARVAEVRAANERLFPPDGIRDRLRALGLPVRLNQQVRVQAARGALPWEGDLDAMRRDQTPAYPAGGV